MPYQDLQGLGMKGLNTDTQAQALDHTQFSAGMNMRPFDGSLQAVFAFGTVDPNITPITMPGDDTFESRLDVTALSGWIETGANELRIAYLWQADDDSYHLQIINDLSTTGNFINGADAETMLTDNPRWGQQLLAFNGILLVNDSVNQPIFVKNNGTTDAPDYEASFVAGWLSSAYDNLTEADQVLLDDGSLTIAAGDYTDDPFVLRNYTSRTQFEQINQALSDTRVTCERLVAYNNRLIAVNIQGNYLDAALGNSTLVFSTPITELNSLNGVTFRFTQFNSAGDDILTETPGEIVDGGVLGEYLIIYKDDAVYRYQDVGDPLFLIGEVQFSDDGLYSPDCFVDIGGSRHVVLGNYGVYIHQGGPQKQNISRNRIQEALYSSINKTVSLDADDRPISQKDKTFLYHNENDKEVWICFPTTNTGDCDEAYIYNYEYDAWYIRELPGTNGIRGISSFQKDGELWLLSYGDDGVRRLSDERQSAEEYEQEASVEMHYMDFGDPSKVKYVMAVYPHTMGDITVSLEASNKLGAANTPTFPDSMIFDSDLEYKQDWRIHGRYYHIKVANMALVGDNGGTNPQLTGLGIEVKLGGDR